jgi:hypothetical protein
MAFEYSAESYRASAGFCGVMGRNNWHYKLWNGKGYVDLRFFDFVRTIVHDKQSGGTEEQEKYANYWGDEEYCRVGDNYQISGENGAVRTWVSPHRGSIRIEGNVHIDNDSDEAATATIMHNAQKAWLWHLVKSGKTGLHDLTMEVEKGDAIHFIVERSFGKKGEKVIWDPVITYEDK